MASPLLKGISSGEVRDIVKKAKDQGWTIDRTSKNHLKFVPPPGLNAPVKGCAFFSGSTSDWRAVRALRTKLRQRGMDI